MTVSSVLCCYFVLFKLQGRTPEMVQSEFGQSSQSAKHLKIHHRFLMLTLETIVVANDAASFWRVLVDPELPKTC